MLDRVRSEATVQGSFKEVATMLVIGKRGGLMRELAGWLVVGAIIGLVLNSKDIQRYLQIRAM